jgi:hypothetical protein
MRLLAPRRFGLLRAAGGLVDYAIAEPLHSAMVRKMMLGLKQRAEQSQAARVKARGPAA